MNKLSHAYSIFLNSIHFAGEKKENEVKKGIIIVIDGGKKKKRKNIKKN